MKTQKDKVTQIKRRCKDLIQRSTEDQKDLAKKMGIGEEAFRQYATGRTPVPLYHLESFCESMGVSVEYIITGHEHPLIDAYNSAPSDDKRLAEKVLNVKWNHPKKTGT